MDESKVHIGQFIRSEMRRQGRRTVWLANELGCHRNNVYLIYSRSWIDTETLMKISLVLHHDFFADLSKGYQYTTATNSATASNCPD
ncbi:MAG: XRE family transcriptional regulator [Bacteroidales bacterium]|nr:XRE family transcriptional regulator [Bacteroidales bacterium]